MTIMSQTMIHNLKSIQTKKLIQIKNSMVNYQMMMLMSFLNLRLTWKNVENNLKRINLKKKKSLSNQSLMVMMSVDKSKSLSKNKWKTTILTHWLKLWLLLKRCWEMDQKRKLSKTVIEDSLSKIMMTYQNGLLKIKRNITLRRHLSLKNNSLNKRRDSWLSMQEYQRKSCKQRSERKSECKRNSKRFRKRLKSSWTKTVSTKSASWDKLLSSMTRKSVHLKKKRNTLSQRDSNPQKEKTVEM